MSTDIETASELEAFHQWIGQRLAAGERHMPVDEALTQFRRYQAELNHCRAEVDAALQESERGESRQWDVEAFLDRAEARLEHGDDGNGCHGS